MNTRGRHPCGRDHNRIRQLAFRAVTRMARSTGCLCAVPTVLGQRSPLGSFDPSGLVAVDDHDVRAYSVEVLHELGYRVAGGPRPPLGPAPARVAESAD